MELKNKKEIKNALNNLIKDIIDDIIKILTLIMVIKKKFIKKKKIEINGNDINIKNDNKISNTSYSNEIKFLYELKVFLFKKDDFIIINITPNEIIKMIKEKILIKQWLKKNTRLQKKKIMKLRIIEKIGNKFIYKFFHFQDAKSIIIIISKFQLLWKINFIKSKALNFDIFFFKK